MIPRQTYSRPFIFSSSHTPSAGVSEAVQHSNDGDLTGRGEGGTAKQQNRAGRRRQTASVDIRQAYTVRAQWDTRAERIASHHVPRISIPFRTVPLR